MNDIVNIKLIQQRITVLRNGCREHNDLVQLSHTFHELIHSRSFYDVDIVERTLDLDGYREIRLMKKLIVR